MAQQHRCSLYVVHRFGKSKSASVSMRGATLVRVFNEIGDSALVSDKTINPADHVGDTFIFIKPKFLRLPLLLAKTNIVVIDPLDFVHQLPKIKLPFHFFFTSKKSLKAYSIDFQPLSQWLFYHHFDPRITSKSKVRHKWIGYCGDPIKLSNNARSTLQIQNLRFNELLAGFNYEFHWTIKPSKFQYEPLTKTVTAIASGSIPIINTNELGEILPAHYPFHIGNQPKNSEIEKLILALNDEGEKATALKAIKNIKIADYSESKFTADVLNCLKKLEIGTNPTFKQHFSIHIHDWKLRIKEALDSRFGQT